MSVSEQLARMQGGSGTQASIVVKREAKRVERECDPTTVAPSGEVENAAPRDYLVWSFEHNAWWGPDQRGYCTNILAAGLYTREEADEITQLRDPKGRCEEARPAAPELAKFRASLDQPNTFGAHVLTALSQSRADSERLDETTAKRWRLNYVRYAGWWVSDGRGVHVPEADIAYYPDPRAAIDAARRADHA